MSGNSPSGQREGCDARERTRSWSPYSRRIVRFESCGISPTRGSGAAARLTHQACTMSTSAIQKTTHETRGIPGLALGAIGVVFGDIGTSPLIGRTRTAAGRTGSIALIADTTKGTTNDLKNTTRLPSSPTRPGDVQRPALSLRGDRTIEQMERAAERRRKGRHR